MTIRLGFVSTLLVGSTLLFSETAAAHGLELRADLPIPQWLFGWAAALVLIASFVALAVLWPKPKLEDGGWRPLPYGFGRILASRPLEIACGVGGVFLLGVVIWSGFAGTEIAFENAAPTFVYVVFWLGLVPVSVLFGDVFRAFNPWRALGRATSWVAGRLAGETVPAPLTYPDGLGRWPAAAGLLAFAWLELVSPEGTAPRNLAAATLIYTSLTVLGMLLFGVETWTERGEAFSVYFNLFSRMAPFERRGNEIGFRKPLSGLASLRPLAGTVAVVTVMIATVTYDGASEGSLWQTVAEELDSAFASLGLSAGGVDELTGSVGMLCALLLIGGFYRLGLVGARRMAGGHNPGLPVAFAHSLVPIALAYVAAHYFTLLLYQGQAVGYLSSDPLGKGWNLFGTADVGLDLSLIGSETTWYLQVALVVMGHVAGLVLAHDRALVLYERAHVAVRSQYWMLGVMVGFTSLALWLLSQANA